MNRRILTVTALTLQIKEKLESSFPQVVVSGEISDLSEPQSGHKYFTLKDSKSQIRGVVWRSTSERLSFPLRNGQEVVCRGNLDLYPPRGSYQLVVRQVEPVGVGDWQLRLRELQRKLAAEGFFDPARKKSLPRFIHDIVLVTSPSGAAIHDFLEVAKRRWPCVHIRIAPVRVQGEGAGLEIARMVRRLQRLRPRPQALVIARGGGSIEDLWCFNDESLVKSIYQSEIPVVSAVGHEVDVSLCDLAADVRALTPSEAAERVLPSSQDIAAFLLQLQQRLSTALQNRADSARKRLESLAQRRPLRRPLDEILQRQRRLDEIHQRALRAVTRKLEQARHHVGASAARLEALSPLGVLARGYAVALDETGNLIPQAQGLETGQTVELRFRDGQAITEVQRVNLREETPPSS